MKITTFLKRMFCIFLLLFFLIGCAHTISSVEKKWGPPAKIEQFDDKTIYYYYFQKGRGSAVAVGRGPVVVRGDSSAGWWTVELTADQTGNIIKKREYWKQPKLD